MKIKTTAQEIMDRGRWEEFCELKGVFVWAVSEGLMDGSEEFELTMEEVGNLGLSDVGCLERNDV